MIQHKQYNFVYLQSTAHLASLLLSRLFKYNLEGKQHLAFYEKAVPEAVHMVLEVKQKALKF